MNNTTIPVEVITPNPVNVTSDENSTSIQTIEKSGSSHDNVNLSCQNIARIVLCVIFTLALHWS